MSAIININEVHPNPEAGSEWIELFINEEINSNLNLSSYTIFDNYHQIYKFTNEEFSDQLLVVEVSGLNNDKDSVILKDNNGEILDSFQYEETEKGLSFIRNQISNTFTIGTASKNQINPNITLEPSPTQEQLANSTPTPTKTSPTPIEEYVPTKSLINSSDFSPTISLSQKPNSTVNAEVKYHNYDLDQIKLETENKIFAERLTRLVFLGVNQGQTKIINAIIGSSLIVLSSLFLIYAKFKRHHN